MTALLPFLFGILLVSCASGLIVQQVFFSRLRKLHTSTWDQLGKPVIFLNSGAMNAGRFIGFIWRRDYEGLPDPKTVELGRFLRAFYIFYILLFVTVLVVFILAVGRPHR